MTQAQATLPEHQKKISDDLTVKQDKPHLSYSQLSCLFMCPEKYRRRYILKERRPGGIQLHRGVSFHHGAEKYFFNKKNRLRIFSKDEFRAIVSDKFDESIKEGVLFTDEDKEFGIQNIIGNTKDKLMILSDFFVEDVGPHIQPKFVEIDHRLVMPGEYDILMRLDLVDTHGVVRDFKVTKNKMNQNDADISPQLTLYEIAYHDMTGNWATGVGLDNISITEKTNKVAYQFLQSKRTTAHFAAFGRYLEQVLELLDKGIFLPRPAQSSRDWHCSNKYCAYWVDCPFVVR